MSKPAKLAMLALTASIAGFSGSALAQDANPTATAAPTTPAEAPVYAPSANPTAGEVPSVSVTTVPTDASMAVPAPVVIDIPKADEKFVEKMVNHLNNKEVEDIISIFSKEGFVAVTEAGKIVKDQESLRRMLLDMFTGDKKHKFAATVENVNNFMPGAAVITYNITMTDEANAEAAPVKLIATSVVRYEDNNWKVVAVQKTEAEKAAPVEEHKSGTSGVKMLLIALIGAAVGFFASRFMPKKDSAQA